jgi:hypothetical protein
MMDTAADATAATLAAKIAIAEAGVMAATAQEDLANAIAQQAQDIAEEAAQQRSKANALLDKAQCDCSATVDKIKNAALDESIMVAEVNHGKMEQAATTKGHITYGA